jgi:putative membrane protein
MTDTGAPIHTNRFEVRATADSHFSWLRTRMALETTMMAWVRTSVSLIAFGFTIVQFFERMATSPTAKPPYFPDAPHYLGLALIFCGVMGLAISMWEYKWTLHYLWSGNFAVIAGATKDGKQTPLFAVTIALSCIGIFAFFAVLLRLV